MLVVHAWCNGEVRVESPPGLARTWRAPPCLVDWYMPSPKPRGRVALAEYAWQHGDVALCARCLSKMTTKEIRTWLELIRATLPLVVTPSD